MFRFMIRDVLWLTVVVALALGWWLMWRSLPDYAKASGSISVAGSPISDGRVCFHSADGQIIGAQVVKGQFHIHQAPVGKFLVTIDGEGVPPKYSSNKSPLSIDVRKGVSTFNFELR